MTAFHDVNSSPPTTVKWKTSSAAEQVQTVECLERAADMSALVTTRLRSLKVYFGSNFHSGDFAYVLYPFLRIFKLFGFAPVKLKNGEILQQHCASLEWDGPACVWSSIGVIGYFVGFFVGAHHLSMTENWAKLEHAASVITYFTSWAQILTLFTLGAAALLSAWTRLGDTRRLCALLFRIDRRLRAIADIRIDYRTLRRRLFIEFAVAFAVPVTLSMVNCMIIQRASFRVGSSCFWFVCFAPIMLITFKEFQFYNLLFVLKTKFDIVNAKLRLCAAAASGGTASERLVVHVHVRKVQSVSEMLLTALPPNSVEECLPEEEQPEPAAPPPAPPPPFDGASVILLQQLLEVYSLSADGVELVLRIFGGHLLLMTTVSFGVITIQSYNLFALIVHSLALQPYQIVVVIAWILVQIAVIGINVSACSMTAKTMAKTGPLLHKIKLQTSAQTPTVCLFYQQLQLFSLEVLQRKSNFTAAGFFNMDYKLITSIIAAVTTYLVIIIQFHLTNMTDSHKTPTSTPPP